MEELLMEMKSDVSRLPGELAKIPSVSTQLKMDEISTISKAAHKETAPVIINNASGGGSTNVRSGSVITHTHTPAEVMTTSVTQQPHVSTASVISEGLKRHSHSGARSSSPRHSSRRQTTAVPPAPAEDKVSIVAGNNIATAPTAPVAYATTGGAIQLPAAAAAGATTIQLPATAATGNTIQLSGTAGGTIQIPAGSLLQTADGLVVYQGVQTSGGGVQQTATAQKTATIVQQQATSGTQSSNNAATYAIGVPTYVDGSGGTAAAVYLQGQTVQLVQVSGGGTGQQFVYLPSVVQGGQAVTTTQAGAQIAVLSTDANGAPVITID